MLKIPPVNLESTFHSTRDSADPISFSRAFAAGLAPDGGLYIPSSLPKLPEGLLEVADYPDLAFRFLSLFDGDHTPTELRALVDRSYASFDDPANAAPLRQISDHTFVLELFHGPTLAFKDFGLQLVGHLFEDQIGRSRRPINVLGATSGDTGAAAIHGLANKEGVNVFILFPKGRISPLQERQMTCTGAPNIFPIPVEGSFDDAQRVIKDLFGDLPFKEETALSAVNSINLARILAQSIYYLAAYRQLPANNRENVRFAVPTGNFGNIFAGWLACRMGLPAEKLIIATNQNDILYRLFHTGIYEPGSVSPSFAPSMDIQIASNFERFLYYQSGEDPGRVTASMRELRENGRLEIPDFQAGLFTATRCDDRDILRLIAETRKRFDYIADPHTACGFQDLDPDANTVILSTAHPAKFPDTIHAATGEHPTHPTLEALLDREPVTYPLENTPGAIRAFILANKA
jgi:threonine synthase